MNGTILFRIIYILLSVLTAGFDIFIFRKCGKKSGSLTRSLKTAAVCAVIVDFSYLFSILFDNYIEVSVMSSIYFSAIDWLLVSTLFFAWYQTGHMDDDSVGRRGLFLCIFIALIETISFALNPVTEHAISYQLLGGAIAPYSYVMKPMYYFHLVFTYSMVALILGLFIRKSAVVPRIYRKPFSYVIAGILFIVFINAIFLFAPGNELINRIDISILGYSVVLNICFYTSTGYTEKAVLKDYAGTVFDNIQQGIVMFDYAGNLVMQNAKAEQLLPMIHFSEQLTSRMFLDYCGIGIEDEDNGELDSRSVQCYLKTGIEIRPLRCDMTRIRGEKNRLLGLLLVFTDLQLDTDLLTGFHNFRSFRNYAESMPFYYEPPVVVAILDITHLSIINASYGRSEGDRRIRRLADAMRECFPQGTYYIRGDDAHLIALCRNMREEDASEWIRRVREQYKDGFEYAVGMTDNSAPDIVEMIYAVSRAMKSKKLLNQDSSHSEILKSLARALQESDSDTEAHVSRTRRMGAQLGKRIGLTDIQQTQLSLLCLLHDIGKIGIPLEILNKPGRLTVEEWSVLRSHVEKGYQIAKSSEALSDIAEMILCHHERWDGKGYPSGLTRESIPLLSRIIAVVDAYDAMVNNRSYRRAIDKQKARAEIRKGAGSQFDPYIASEFLLMLEEEDRKSLKQENEEQTAAADIESFETETDRASEISEAEYRRESSAEMVSTNVHRVQHSRYILDSNDNIIAVDDAFTEMTGYDRSDIEGRKLSQIRLIPEEDRINYIAVTGEQLSKNDAAYLEHRLLRKDGNILYVFCHGRRYYDSAVREERSEIIITDAMHTYSVQRLVERENRRARAQLTQWEKTYRSDSLTGLLTHAAFQNDVQMRILEGDSRIMFLMMDIDKFKQYNDTYGHSAGDEFLILFAQTLKASLRREDIPCRMGGDEFATALFFKKDSPDSLMRERARQIFDRIQLAIRSHCDETGLSMGAVIANEKLNSFQFLYKEADRALYRAKESGRNRLCFAEDEGEV